MIDAIKRFLGFHDSSGLKHSLKHLQSMKQKIAFLPKKEQAKYADAVTIKNVNEGWFLAQIHSIDPSDKSIFRNLNTTSVGNMAHISLFCNDYLAKHKANIILYNYKTWLKSFN